MELHLLSSSPYPVREIILLRSLSKEWVDKAEHDFYSADLLLHAGQYPIPDTASFHCQQCAEKYLKAFLQSHKVRFERTHILMDLLNLYIPLESDFKKIADDLNSLEGYAVAIRYPGAIIPVELAEEALATTGRIREFVRRKLKIK